MKCYERPIAILVACAAALLADAVPGQSLSILRSGQGQFYLQSSVPSGSRYVVQESANLHLWADITDQLSGPSSNQIDNAGASERFFRLTPWTPPAPLITVMLLGDSTVADFTNDLGLVNGWGQGIYGYFKSNVRVIDLAYPGYSTRVFLASDEMARMLVIKPDYVLIGFGEIDQFGETNRATTLQEFADNLTTIVQAIRGFNGTPILVTPPAQKYWDAQGKIIPVYQDRFNVVRNTAAQLQTYLIDLDQLSRDLLNKLGKEGSEYIWWSVPDYLHFSDKGAKIIAGLVANALPDILGPCLVGIFDPLPGP